MHGHITETFDILVYRYINVSTNIYRYLYGYSLKSVLPMGSGCSLCGVLVIGWCEGQSKQCCIQTTFSSSVTNIQVTFNCYLLLWGTLLPSLIIWRIWNILFLRIRNQLLYPILHITLNDQTQCWICWFVSGEAKSTDSFSVSSYRDNCLIFRSIIIPYVNTNMERCLRQRGRFCWTEVSP